MLKYTGIYVWMCSYIFRIFDEVVSFSACVCMFVSGKHSQFSMEQVGPSKNLNVMVAFIIISSGSRLNKLNYAVNNW